MNLEVNWCLWVSLWCLNHLYRRQVRRRWHSQSLWSDHVKEDAVLASLKPSFLPTDAPGVGVSGVVAVSPQRPMSLTSDVVTPEMRLQYAQMVERTLIAENQRLKEEGERLRSLVNFYDEQRHGDSRASSW